MRLCRAALSPVLDRRGVVAMGLIRRVLRWLNCSDLPALPQSEARRRVIAEREYRRKRERLRRAVAVGDIDEVKRLTKELAGR